jgi:hypothetical protein
LDYEKVRKDENIRKLFFELIQTAMGNRENLSWVPTTAEWSAIYEESKKQAITGVMVNGLERLPKEQRPGKELLLQWIGLGEQIRQTNLNLTKRCIELQKKLSGVDVRTSILKGQGVAKCYLMELRDLRQSGDIDIYVDCDMKEALTTTNDVGFTVEGWDYKHAHLRVWKDTEVEMHYRVEVLLNLWKNRKLQKWFEKKKEQLFGERDGLVTPTVSFNLFYILLHIYRHFLYEGVGMRQLMDYYFVLKSHSDSKDNSEILNVLQEFGMMRFARGVMWLMQEVFGLAPKYMYCEPLESEGRFILGEVMAGGNFGHHDQRLTHGCGKLNTVKQVCRHNWHLMSHYPSDVIWAPIWFVWHKWWKLKTKALMAIR